MDEHLYFRAIEGHFIRLRGAPLLLSPEDYQVAKRWWSEGIPLEVIHGALETVFGRRAERRAKGPIQSLRYCAPAVEAAWKRAGELLQADRREAVAPLEIGPRLERLAARIPDSEAELRSEILGLSGGAEEVEQALAALDSRLLDSAAGSLDREARAALERWVERCLAQLGERMVESELEAARGRLFEQALRRELELPVLSLFTDP